jgi:MFS family permease
MQHFLLWARRLPLAPLALTLLGASLWPEMELLVPSLPAMKNHFGVSEGEIQQLLSTNFIGFLCGIFLAGPLCDSLGRKRVCIWGALLFLLASLGAALSGDFFGLMLARFLQGLTVTAPIIAGSALLMELSSGRGQIYWMSMSSARYEKLFVNRIYYYAYWLKYSAFLSTYAY